MTDAEESVSDVSIREDSSCKDDEITDGPMSSGSASFLTAEDEASRKSYKSRSFESSGDSTENTREHEACVQHDMQSQVSNTYPTSSIFETSTKESPLIQQEVKVFHRPTVETSIVSRREISTAEANVTTALAAVSSNVSSIEEAAKWSSMSRATHANDILVEIEVSVKLTMFNHFRNAI